MKNKILLWLGIPRFLTMRDARIELLEKEGKMANHKIENLERELTETRMYVKGIINLFDIEFTKEVIPHPGYLEPEPITMPIFVARKRKSK